MIIDVFSHHISKSVGKKIGGAFGESRQYKYPSQNADPEVRLGLMDKYGVDVQVLTQTTPVLLGFGPEDAAEICRLSNDDNYALCKAYPDRFVNVCMVSLLDVPSAVNELERSVNELDCRGVTISSNQNGKGLDSPDYFPFYEQLAKHELPLLIHPTDWESYPLVSNEDGWWMMQVCGWPFDTTQAIWRIMLGGVLDRFPTLKIVTHHMGAMFPYFARRIEQTFDGILRDKVQRRFSEYWQNIFGDTAVNGTVGAYPCGYAFFGPDRLMYGTDYPFGPEKGEDFIRENLAGVRSMDIPDEDKKKILGETAKRLFRI